MEFEIYQKKLEYEISNFVKIWLIVLVCQCYCYGIGKIVPKGFKRLIALLPVLYLFLRLPLRLHSFHLGDRTFFFITWLGTSKLLLFAFGKGPLCSDKTSLSLPVFVAVASLPIKLRSKNGQTKTEDDHDPKLLESMKTYLIAAKVLLLAIVVYIDANFTYIHANIALLFALVHWYLILELLLVLVSALVGFLLGIELDPTSGEPYLASSLQDFWSRRWNLTVHDILQEAVFQPCLKLFTYITGRKLAPLPSVFATFLASGLLHEFTLYYLGCKKPSWEMTSFFLLHGVCVMIEIATRKSAPAKWHLRLPRFISGPLVLGFVVLTASWFYFPSTTNCNVHARTSYEYQILGGFVMNLWHSIGFV